MIDGSRLLDAIERIRQRSMIHGKPHWVVLRRPLAFELGLRGRADYRELDELLRSFGYHLKPTELRPKGRGYMIEAQRAIKY